jgi:putative ABC transport system permease protein
VSEDKLVLGIRGVGENRERLDNELLKLPEISSVVFSSEAPTQDNENNNNFTLVDGESVSGENPTVLLNYHNLGYGFFEAYGVEPLAGRLFDEAYGSDQVRPLVDGQDKINTASLIINEKALQRLGFSSPQQAIGKTMTSAEVGQTEFTVIGVVPDIYFRSIKFGVRPTAYMLNPNRFRVANLTFKTNDIPQLMGKIESVWKEVAPLQPINLQFLDEMMKAQYEQEAVQARMFSAFSLLAIVIACLGLYGLAAFTTERRTREIGIRKVMGARIWDIIVLLIWQFSKPVIVANVIAWPVAIYAMLNWLESFSYRIDSLWILPICLGVSLSLLFIAWLTVGSNAAKVASANPIKALRQE